jgi:virulence-associated protein VagC
MKSKKIRNMKVYEQSGYNYRATPTIVLKGCMTSGGRQFCTDRSGSGDQWLKDMGFDIGMAISVTCEDGKLIITPDAEQAAIAKAEAEFMEKEMKKLEKRFQAEKEQIHAQFVAERSSKYCGREVQ